MLSRHPSATPSMFGVAGYPLGKDHWFMARLATFHITIDNGGKVFRKNDDLYSVIDR